MADDVLGDRRKALEDEFFRRQDAALLEKQRSKEQKEAARAALAAASRVTDAHLLDQLVSFGITPDTLTALSLVPLVEVAWADGKVDPAERQTIMAAAEAMGLQNGGTGYRLIENALSMRPAARLREMWEQYIRAMCKSMSAEERAGLKNELLQRARQVAEAAGGFLGVGPKTSAREKALLDELAHAFE